MLRHNLHVIAFILVFIVGYLNVDAQEAPMRFQQVGKLEDYSSPITYCVFQDSRGLIWIGTQKGLDLFDGTCIHSYSSDLSHPHGLPSKGIRSITEDKHNNLWLVSLDGILLKFDLENEKFSRQTLPWDEDKKGNNGDRIQLLSIKYDISGIIWLGTTKGLHGYHVDQDSVFRVPIDEDIKSKAQQSIGTRTLFMDFDTTGVLWVADREGFYYFDHQIQRLIPQSFTAPESDGKGINCYDMSMDQDGCFWILGRRSELVKFNPYSGTVKTVRSRLLSEPLSRFGAILVDKQNHIWILYSYGGLIQYNPFTDKIARFSTSSLPSFSYDFFEDSQGNIFITTSEGVKSFDLRASEIITHNLYQKNKSGDNWLISKIMRDKQIFLIGTYGSGLIILETETGKTVNIRAGDSPANLESDFIRGILKDKNDRIWIWAGNTLHRYEPQREQFERFTFNFLGSITTDEAGNFWILDYDKVICFDPVNLDTTIFPLYEDLQFAPESVLHFSPLFISSDSVLWMGGLSGVFKIDPINGKWIRYKIEEKIQNRYELKRISDIHYDSRNRIWVATDMGISRLDLHPGSDSITIITQFPEYSVRGPIISISEDFKGNIWMSSGIGIHVIRPDGTFSSFSYKDGLPESPRLIWSLDSDPNGSIYAGTLDFIEIQPGFIKPNDIIPPILLTGFSLNGNRIFPGEESPLKKSIIFADHIDLKHDQNFFRVDFAALNFEHSESNQYRYILKGVDVDTIFSEERSYAEYTDLAPGNYTFWVTGSNNSGFWNPEGTSITIRIHPPWYRSFLALGIYLLLFMTLLLSYIRIRTIRLQREKTYLEIEVRNRTEEIRQKNEQILEMDTLKTRFFNNISHEFRTLVTMVKAPAETIMQTEKLSRNGSKGMEMIYRNIIRLMKLVNQLLDISRIDKKSMKLILSEENAFNFFHEIAVSFAVLAEASGVQYLYNIQRTSNLVWFDADKLEKIVNNLLSNAFKFTGEGGKVRLDIMQKDQPDSTDKMLEISVSDTGKGILKEEQGKIFDRFYQVESNLKKEGGGTGIGLALTRDLVNLMHGTINLDSIPGKGSSFTVVIPVGKNHLADGEFTLCESKTDLKQSAYAIPHFQDSVLEKSSTETKANRETKETLVLIVEDNADILRYLCNELGTEFGLIEAVDGSAGLKLAEEHMPDLIITDLMMPRMDGYELCKKLKSDVRTSHIPIIVLSAKATLNDKLKGLETGADDYISKPFDINEIRIRAKNLIDQRRKLREKFGKEITLDPMDIVITSVDEKFLIRAMNVVDSHMSDASFDIAEFSDKMNMSRSTLFRKLEALTNMSPVEFIRNLRIKRAATLLKQKYGNVTEVALEVGFNNPSYFTKVFKKVFSVTPAQFAKS